MKKFLFLSLFLSFLFAQCNKDDLGDETLVEGTVLEYGTNKPLANVPIKILKVSGQVFGSTTYTTTSDSTRTNSRGTYSIRFKHDDKASYEATWVEKRYIGDNGALLDNGRRNKFDFVLVPPAWLKLRVINVSKNQGDTIYVQGGAYFTDTNLDKMLPIETRLGNRYNVISWYIKKNNIGALYRDSLYTPAFDTLSYEIKF